MEKYGEILIRILRVKSFAETVKCIRAYKEIEISQIQLANESQKPLPVFQLYGLDHNELEKKLQNLFSCLENSQTQFELILDDEVISKEMFQNLMNRWKQIGEETERHIQLEMGYLENNE